MQYRDTVYQLIQYLAISQVYTHQVPVSLTHSERQRHFSFWLEQLDLRFGLHNHSLPMIL